MLSTLSACSCPACVARSDTFRPTDPEESKGRVEIVDVPGEVGQLDEKLAAPQSDGCTTVVEVEQPEVEDMSYLDFPSNTREEAATSFVEKKVVKKGEMAIAGAIGKAPGSWKIVLIAY